MTELKYIGKHKPSGMVIDVDESRAKELISTLEYERLIQVKKKVVKKEVLSKNVNFERTYK